MAEEKILHLTLKKKWFDMIDSGEKKEEYRQIKEYWKTRLGRCCARHYDIVVFRNGYAKNSPKITFECLGIVIGIPKPEWSDNWKEDVFIIKLGNKISSK